MLSRNLNLALLLGGLTLTDAFAITSLQKRDTTAQLTIGSTYVPLSTIDGAQFVGDSLRTICSDNGCDSGTPQSVSYAAQFSTYGDIVGCTWTLTASGNYDSTDERDYMIALLTQTLTFTASLETITVSIEDNSLCTHQGQPSCTDEELQITSGVNFQQVVLNLENGANTAQLEYHLSVQCQDTAGFDCPSVVSGNLKDILSAVPGVGAVIAQIFDLACAA